MKLIGEVRAGQRWIQHGKLERDAVLDLHLEASSIPTWENKKKYCTLKKVENLFVLTFLNLKIQVGGPHQSKLWTHFIELLADKNAGHDGTVADIRWVPSINLEIKKNSQ